MHCMIVDDNWHHGPAWPITHPRIISYNFAQAHSLIRVNGKHLHKKGLESLRDPSFSIQFACQIVLREELFSLAYIRRADKLEER